MLEAELEGVRAADVAQVVFETPARLLGSIEGRRAPTGKFGEVDGGEVLIAIDHIFDANLVFPVLVHIRRIGVLDEGIPGERNVIHHV